MKKLAAVLTLVLTSFMVTPGLAAPANADDDYTSGVRTSCHIDMPATIDAGANPRIRVTVRPNGPAPAAASNASGRAAKADQPTGSVTVRITRNGTGIFTETVAYNGSPVTIVGPPINQVGRYVVHARFRADDGTVFRSCQNTTSFELDRDGGPDGPDGPGDPDGPGSNPGNDSPGGLLPDTGGPDLRWLLIGLVLVGSGAGMVYAARRQPRGPLYDV